MPVTPKTKHIFTNISRPKDLSSKLTESLYTHIKKEENKNQKQLNGYLREEFMYKNYFQL